MAAPVPPGAALIAPIGIWTRAPRPAFEHLRILVPDARYPGPSSAASHGAASPALAGAGAGAGAVSATAPAPPPTPRPSASPAGSAAGPPAPGRRGGRVHGQLIATEPNGTMWMLHIRGRAMDGGPPGLTPGGYADLEPVACILGHTRPIAAMALAAPDVDETSDAGAPSALLSIDTGGALLMTSLADGRYLEANLDAVAGTPTAMLLAAGGAFLVVAGQSHIVSIFHMPSLQLLSETQRFDTWVATMIERVEDGVAQILVFLTDGSVHACHLVVGHGGGSLPSAVAGPASSAASRRSTTASTAHADGADDDSAREGVRLVRDPAFAVDPALQTALDQPILGAAVSPWDPRHVCLLMPRQIVSAQVTLRGMRGLAAFPLPIPGTPTVPAQIHFVCETMVAVAYRQSDQVDFFYTGAREQLAVVAAPLKDLALPATQRHLLSDDTYGFHIIESTAEPLMPPAPAPPAGAAAAERSLFIHLASVRPTAMTACVGISARGLLSFDPATQAFMAFHGFNLGSVGSASAVSPSPPPSLASASVAGMPAAAAPVARPPPALLPFGKPIAVSWPQPRRRQDIWQVPPPPPPGPIPRNAASAQTPRHSPAERPAERPAAAPAAGPMAGPMAMDDAPQISAMVLVTPQWVALGMANGDLLLAQVGTLLRSLTSERALRRHAAVSFRQAHRGRVTALLVCPRAEGSASATATAAVAATRLATTHAATASPSSSPSPVAESTGPSAASGTSTPAQTRVGPRRSVALPGRDMPWLISGGMDGHVVFWNVRCSAGRRGLGDGDGDGDGDGEHSDHGDHDDQVDQADHDDPDGYDSGMSRSTRIGMGAGMGAVVRIPGHTTPVTHLAAVPLPINGHTRHAVLTFAASPGDGSVCLIDPQLPALTWRFVGHTAPAHHVYLRADHDLLLLVLRDGSLWGWHLRTGHLDRREAKPTPSLLAAPAQHLVTVPEIGGALRDAVTPSLAWRRPGAHGTALPRRLRRPLLETRVLADQRLLVLTVDIRQLLAHIDRHGAHLRGPGHSTPGAHAVGPGTAPRDKTTSPASTVASGGDLGPAVLAWLLAWGLDDALDAVCREQLGLTPPACATSHGYVHTAMAGGATRDVLTLWWPGAPPEASPSPPSSSPSPSPTTAIAANLAASPSQSPLQRYGSSLDVPSSRAPRVEPSDPGQRARIAGRRFTLSPFAAAQALMPVLTLARHLLTAAHGSETAASRVMTFYGVLLPGTPAFASAATTTPCTTATPDACCWPAWGLLVRYMADPGEAVRQAARALFEASLQALCATDDPAVAAARARVIAHWVGQLRPGLRLTDPLSHPRHPTGLALLTMTAGRPSAIGGPTGGGGGVARREARAAIVLAHLAVQQPRLLPAHVIAVLGQTLVQLAAGVHGSHAPSSLGPASAGAAAAASAAGAAGHGAGAFGGSDGADSVDATTPVVAEGGVGRSLSLVWDAGSTGGDADGLLSAGSYEGLGPPSGGRGTPSSPGGRRRRGSGSHGRPGHGSALPAGAAAAAPPPSLYRMNAIELLGTGYATFAPHIDRLQLVRTLCHLARLASYDACVDGHPVAEPATAGSGSLTPRTAARRGRHPRDIPAAGASDHQPDALARAALLRIAAMDMGTVMAVIAYDLAALALPLPAPPPPPPAPPLSAGLSGASTTAAAAARAQAAGRDGFFRTAGTASPLPAPAHPMTPPTLAHRQDLLALVGLLAVAHPAALAPYLVTVCDALVLGCLDPHAGITILTPSAAAAAAPYGPSSATASASTSAAAAHGHARGASASAAAAASRHDAAGLSSPQVGRAAIGGSPSPAGRAAARSTHVGLGAHLPMTRARARDALQPGVTSALATLRRAYPARLVFARGPQALACGSGDGAIVVYDLRTGTRAQVLAARPPPAAAAGGAAGSAVTAIAFARDGRLLASWSAGEGCLRVWAPSLGFLGSLTEALSNVMMGGGTSSPSGAVVGGAAAVSASASASTAAAAAAAGSSGRGGPVAGLLAPAPRHAGRSGGPPPAAAPPHVQDRTISLETPSPALPWASSAAAAAAAGGASSRGGASPAPVAPDLVAADPSEPAAGSSTLPHLKLFRIFENLVTPPGAARTAAAASAAAPTSASASAPASASTSASASVAVPPPRLTWTGERSVTLSDARVLPMDLTFTI